MRVPALVCSVLLLLVSSARAGEEAWVKAQSPHFLVLSNGTTKQARDVALGFEQIRAVFTTVLPGLHTDSSAEDIVFAVKDEGTFTTLLPFEKKQARVTAGLFLKGWEKDYIFVRLDVPDEDRGVIYHEYVHKLLHLNFTRLPPWLDEGLAEFFGNTRLEKSETLIGVPSPMQGLLRTRTPYPLEVILSAGPSSPYYRDPDKGPMFEAESWGLTHFLMFGPNMGGGQRMNAYLTLLQKEADSKKAFQDTFGDPKEIDKQFNQYIGHFLLSAFALNKTLNVDASSFSSGVMTAAETDAHLGGAYVYFHEANLAESKLTSALSKDPQSALAHENMAFRYFQLGKDEDAKKEFDQAAALNPQSYLALYYQAMLAYHGKTDADSLAALDIALRKVLELNPLFAPAIVVRSQILVQQGKLQDAVNLAEESQKLEPDRAGYATNLAAILVLGHDNADAAKIAAAVAARWGGSDSAEALAVLKQARAAGGIATTAEEQAQETQEMKYAEDMTAVEGVVKSITCEESKPIVVALESGGKTFNFQAGKAHGLGFSDTLWYGADHFNACYHLEGMNAVVRYKAPADPTAPVEFRWLEIRDELIPTSTPAAAN